MGREKISAKVNGDEWQAFLDVADRLGIPVRELLNKDVRFSEMEAAGHKLGRAVAQATTERLALARAERLTAPQPCPTCGRWWLPVRRERDFEALDGPVELSEPVCYCLACRRDFFPSASGVGTRPAESQRGGDR